MRRPAALFPIALTLGAMILAPGAGSADQEPIKIKKCQTISEPGSYQLAQNLSATLATCLSITASMVTIDLAGFTISGATGARTGILASGAVQGIAVRNGAIFGFLAGVILNAPGSIVEGLRVEAGLGGDNGISIPSGIVKGNTVSGFSAGSGILVGVGNVTGNYVERNNFGISVGPGGTVIGNTANNNQQFGIVAECPSNLTDNTAVNNVVTNLVLNGDGCHNEDNVAP